ncbi:prepilin peptidase [Polynucleobacter wuianus]|uniref:prepilin peptidase n=1 Tax=Polynucleobacter wuianus TaxID=1743168 RepID=UPI001C0E87EE|nr:A24 family peptidase [Polynucleobacter wuianus]MBU3610114.1 prepilin peptidase [Polynucleobacter wuianus]
MNTFTAIEIVRTLLVLALVYLAYVDFRSFRLPDFITLPMIAIGLIFNCLSPWKFTGFQDAFTGAVIGYLFLWGLNFIYRAAKKQNGIGMGDAKLLSALGAWLGLSALPGILLVASIGGLFGGLIWLRIQKKSLQTAFPFGPFLAIAGIIELLWPQILQTWIQSNPL